MGSKGPTFSDRGDSAWAFEVAPKRVFRAVRLALEEGADCSRQSGALHESALAVDGHYTSEAATNSVSCDRTDVG